MSSVMPSSTTTPLITLSPPAEQGGWGRLLDERWRETASHRDAARDPFSSARFRAQLGLPTDRPLVMSGHQAAIWHPGILAKYLAASALCSATNAAAAWLIVDQDVNDWRSLRFPVLDAVLHPRRVESRTWSWSDSPPFDAPSGTTPLVRNVAPLPADVIPAADSVLPGLQEIRRALTACADSATHASVASQLAATVAALAEPLLAGPAPTIVMATALARTDLMRELVSRMAADPAAAVLAYNRAVAAHPDAGVAPLTIDRDADDYELPLWRLRAQTRSRVTSSTLADIPSAELAPRALLMTAMLRLAGCDLFIHGTGGGATSADEPGGAGGYDRITESWIADWLRRSLSPSVVATATITLDMDTPAVTDEDAQHASWLAHHARHDPALLGDDDAAAHKQQLLAAIAAAKAAGDRRATADAFAQLQRVLRTAREAAHGIIVDLDRRAEQMRDATRDADVVFDRTWPFPLYSNEQLTALSDSITRTFDA